MNITLKKTITAQSVAYKCILNIDGLEATSEGDNKERAISNCTDEMVILLSEKINEVIQIKREWSKRELD